MCVKNDVVPSFYSRYVENVQRIIEINARLEFEAIWREHARTNKPRCVLSDEISLEIIKLDEELQKTALWDNISLRKTIMAGSVTRNIVGTIGFGYDLRESPSGLLESYFWKFLGKSLYLFAWNWSKSICFLRLYESEVEVSLEIDYKREAPRRFSRNIILFRCMFMLMVVGGEG